MPDENKLEPCVEFTRDPDAIHLINRILTLNEMILKQNGIMIEHLSNPVMLVSTEESMWDRLDKNNKLAEDGEHAD